MLDKKMARDCRIIDHAPVKAGLENLYVILDQAGFGATPSDFVLKTTSAAAITSPVKVLVHSGNPIKRPEPNNGKRAQPAMRPRQNI